MSGLMSAGLLSKKTLGGSGGSVGSSVKSVQIIPVTATGNTTTTYTISSVDATKCIVLPTSEILGNMSIGKVWVSASTVLSVNCPLTYGYTGAFMVIEFYASAVKSVQSGTGTFTAGNTAVTISSVTPSKCICVCLGAYYANSSNYGYISFVSLTATQLTISSISNAFAGASWTVLELN